MHTEKQQFSVKIRFTYITTTFDNLHVTSCHNLKNFIQAVIICKNGRN